MSIGDWLRKVLGRTRPAEGTTSATTAETPLDTTSPVWCVAANVVFERPCGSGGAVKKQGTKHFTPGSKVHVFHFFWGMGGERVTVVGRHRKSKRYITLVMSSKHLANWRAELVYSPHVIRQVREYGEFARFPSESVESRKLAEEIAASYIKGGAASQPFITRPPSV